MKQPRSFNREQAALQIRNPPALPRFYAIAGRLLLVESLDPRLDNLIERLFAGWQLTPVPFPDRLPDIRITFFCDDQPPEIPHNLNQFEIAEGGQCYTGTGDLYLSLGNSLLHLEEGATVSVSLWLSELPGPGDPVFAKATSFAVCAALRRYGIFELHSAGMVHPDSGKGVVIVGQSGSGKSTLAMQLAMAGWPYLSDDELLLSLVDGEVESRGFRSFFAVSEANDAFKTCFEPDNVFISQRRLRTIPRVLFFIRRNGEQKTRIHKLTQVETMTRLIRACPWATYDTSIAGANLEVLSTLARQTTAFDLFAGRDLLEPGYASELLSQHIH